MRLLLVGSFITALAISGCSSSEQATQPEPVAAQATPVADTTAPATTGRHQPSEVQTSMYVRRLNEILAQTGESMTLAEAMPLAASICEFIDGGNSPYDAVQVFTSSGVPEDAAIELVPLAMGAACNQHLS